MLWSKPLEKLNHQRDVSYLRLLVKYTSLCHHALRTAFLTNMITACTKHIGKIVYTTKTAWTQTIWCHFQLTCYLDCFILFEKTWHKHFDSHSLISINDQGRIAIRKEATSVYYYIIRMSVPRYRYKQWNYCLQYYHRHISGETQKHNIYTGHTQNYT